MNKLYYCIFTSDAGEEAIIKRGTITRNSEVRPPLLYNDTNDKKFVISYDPARSRDNSAILVTEIYYDKDDKQYKGRIVNCVNLLDIGKKRKTPMQTPEQIDYLRELILAYNGDAPDYDNILAIMIDGGSGGAGVNIADFLMQDWTDKSGKKHPGLIDKTYSEDYVKKYPNAIDKVHIMQPAQYKSEMYECLIELMNQNCISFTADYDSKGYITVFETDDKALAKAKKEIREKYANEHLNEDEMKQVIERELKDVSCLKTKMIKLDYYEELALANIDSLKEEAVNMVRRKRDSGRDSFELTADKTNRMHDDRIYTAALMAYYLSQKRLEAVRNKVNKKKTNVDDLFQFRAPSSANTLFA